MAMHLKKSMKNRVTDETGFTLIEVVASLVIVGILSVFTSLFIVVGLEGYEFTKKATEAAMNAEIALNRIGLELRSISNITSATPTSIAYTSTEDTLAGNRTIQLMAETLYLTVDGNKYKLIDNLSSALVTVTPADLDNDTKDDVATITVEFELEDIPKFSAAIYPRTIIEKTW